MLRYLSFLDQLVQVMQLHDLNQLVQEQQIPEHNPIFRLSIPQLSYRDVNTYTST